MLSVHDSYDSGTYWHVIHWLKRASDVDVRDDVGMTLLMKACRDVAIVSEKQEARRLLTIVKLCVTRSRQPSLRDLGDNAWTALHYAAHGVQGRSQGSMCHVVRLLLGVDSVDAVAKDHWGNTPLHVASLAGDVATTEELIRLYTARDYDVDQTNGAGMTSLMLAAGHGRCDVVRVLVLAGKASLHVRDDVTHRNWTEWLAAWVKVSNNWKVRKGQQVTCCKLSDVTSWNDLFDLLYITPDDYVTVLSDKASDWKTIFKNLSAFSQSKTTNKATNETNGCSKNRGTCNKSTFFQPMRESKTHANGEVQNPSPATPTTAAASASQLHLPHLLQLSALQLTDAYRPPAKESANEEKLAPSRQTSASHPSSPGGGGEGEGPGARKLKGLPLALTLASVLGKASHHDQQQSPVVGTVSSAGGWKKKMSTVVNTS